MGLTDKEAGQSWFISPSTSLDDVALKMTTTRMLRGAL